MSYSNTTSYKPPRNGRFCGAILMELLTAIIIITALTAAMVSVVAAYGRYNTILLTKQRCIAAGRAQLDCIAATGNPIDDQTFTRMWPSMKCSITSPESTNDTAGLTKVDVTLVAMARKKQITITMSRYILRSPERDTR